MAKNLLPKLTDGWKWNVDDIVPDETIAYHAEDDATAWVEVIDDKHVLAVGDASGQAVGYLTEAAIKALFKQGRS